MPEEKPATKKRLSVKVIKNYYIYLYKYNKYSTLNIYFVKLCTLEEKRHYWAWAAREKDATNHI